MHLKSGVQRISLALAVGVMLSACGERTSPDQARVQEMRTIYQTMESFSAGAEITADYGEQLYTYTVELSGNVAEGSMEVTAPENIAGTTLQWSENETTLTYQDITLETGALTASGLSPADAVPAILAACRSGSLVECCLEGEGDEVLFAEMENPNDESCTVSCWFNQEDCTLQRAELAENGTRVLTMVFSHMEMTIADQEES
jgi:hypothetical protein